MLNLSFKIALIAIILLSPPLSQANSVIDQFLLRDIDSNFTVDLPGVTEISWMDQSEFRFNTNEDGDYSIGLRLRPDFSDRQLHENKNNRLVTLQFEGLRQQQNSERLLQRYHFILDMIEQVAERDALLQALQINKQGRMLHRNLLETSDFDIDSLQKFEFKVQQLEEKSLKASKRVDELTTFVDVRFNINIVSFLENWKQQLLEPDELQDLSSLISSGIHNDQNFTKEILDIEKVNQDLNREVSLSRNWINHIDLRLESTTRGERIIEMALAIPLGRDKRKMQLERVQLTTAQLRLESRRNKQIALVEDFERSIRRLTSDVESVEFSIELLDQQYERLIDSDQLEILLSISLRKLEAVNQLVSLRLRALGNFIDFLYQTNQLARPPLINWLIRNHPRLQE